MSPDTRAWPVARWQRRDGGLRAVAGGTARGIRLRGWRVAARGERVVVGRARAATLPVGEGRVQVQPLEERTVRLERGDQVRVPATGVRVDLPGEPLVTVGVDGQGTIRRDADAVTLEFETPSRLRLAVSEAPRPSVTVTDSATGIAAAVTAAGSAHLVSGAARSHPALRDLPPPVEVGDTVSVPGEIEAAAPPDRPTLTVPADRAATLVCAPLAFYLGAEMVVETEASSTLTLPSVGEEIALPPTGERPQRLLERTFWFDCLVRACTDGSDGPAEAALLDALSTDVSTFADASPGERLVAARDLPARLRGQSLPEWHLATYVQPDGEAAHALPYLLDRLTHIYPPEAEPLAPETFMERSLDDFYRASRPTPSVELVKPELRRGRLHGWLAPETPVEAFKLVGDRLSEGLPRPQERPSLSVTLVLNDPEMVDEHVDVEAAYRRGSPLELNVQTHTELSRDALAAVVESETDLLHFIGHCEPDGLVCPDGNLPAAAVSESQAGVAFLNACGSYHEGVELVRRGSAAGVVTYRGVLDSQAATVGAAFARLITRGFSVERAIRLARRQVMMGMDYGVVGDGTHRVAPGLEPVLLDVTPREDTTYEVACETFADGEIGSTTQVPLAGDDRGRLSGGTATRTVDQSGLIALLAGTDAPVVYDGTVVWPEQLVSRLRKA
jgi:hypothetical protein